MTLINIEIGSSNFPKNVSKLEMIDIKFRTQNKFLSDCTHLKLVRPFNLNAIDLSSFIRLQKIELSFCNSKYSNQVIEDKVQNFFSLFTKVPSAKVVIVKLPEITLETFTQIVVHSNHSNV